MSPAPPPPTTIVVKVKVPPGHIADPSQIATTVSEEYLLGSVDTSTTIRDLRSRIQETVDTNPAPETQRLLYAGRALLEDERTLADALNTSRDPNQTIYTIHLLVRGDRPIGASARALNWNDIRERRSSPSISTAMPDALPGTSIDQRPMEPPHSRSEFQARSNTLDSQGGSLSTALPQPGASQVAQSTTHHGQPQSNVDMPSQEQNVLGESSLRHSDAQQGGTLTEAHDNSQAQPISLPPGMTPNMFASLPRQVQNHLAQAPQSQSFQHHNVPAHHVRFHGIAPNGNQIMVERQTFRGTFAETPPTNAGPNGALSSFSARPMQHAPSPSGFPHGYPPRQPQQVNDAVASFRASRPLFDSVARDIAEMQRALTDLRAQRDPTGEYGPLLERVEAHVSRLREFVLLPGPPPPDDEQAQIDSRPTYQRAVRDAITMVEILGQMGQLSGHVGNWQSTIRTMNNQMERIQSYINIFAPAGPAMAFPRNGTPWPMGFPWPQLPGSSTRGQSQASTASVMGQQSQTQQRRDSNQVSCYLLSSPAGPHALLFSPQYGTYISSSVLPSMPSNMRTGFRPLSTPTFPAAHAWNSVANPAANAAEARPQDPVEAAVRQQVQAVAAEPDNNRAHGQIHVRLIQPILGHLWLLLRILVFFYLWYRTDMGWQRPLILLALGFSFWIFRVGLLAEGAPLRRWWDNIAPIPEAAAAAGRPQPPPEDVQQQYRQRHDVENSQQVGHSDQLPIGPDPDAVRQSALSPEEVALRTLNALDEEARQNRQRGSWLREQIRPVERVVALFVASLWPGVGEAHVRARERELRRLEQVEITRRHRAREEEERTGQEEQSRAAGQEGVNVSQGELGNNSNSSQTTARDETDGRLENGDSEANAVRRRQWTPNTATAASVATN